MDVEVINETLLNINYTHDIAFVRVQERQAGGCHAGAITRH